VLKPRDRSTFGVSSLSAIMAARFVRSTAAAREVRNVFLVSGPHDLVVHVAVETMERRSEAARCSSIVIPAIG
jgi:hypothetical protein